MKGVLWTTLIDMHSTVRPTVDAVLTMPRIGAAIYNFSAENQ